MEKIRVVNKEQTTVPQRYGIETWMFRKEGEIASLLITITLILSLGFLLSLINIWIALGLILWNLILVRLQQVALLGNALRVHSGQFPELYEQLVTYAKRLNTPKVNLYISQDPNPNAYTFGFPHASIVLTSALVENLSPEEVSFTLAHELGHVKAGHNIINVFISPIGTGITAYWNILFSFWKRKAEYTSDRCGLILTKNIDAAIRTMLKISAGLKIADRINMEAYRKQLLKAEDSLSNMGELVQDHPYITNRIKNLILFKKKYFVEPKSIATLSK